MTVHGRDDWQARPARATTPIDPGASVTVHWEGGGLGPYPPGDVPAILRSIQNFHMDTRGWNDIAYNLAVDRYGDLWTGRGPGVRSAANGTVDANKASYAICALVGAGDDEPAALLAGLAEARQWLRDHGYAGDGLYPHRFWTATECPGDRLARWVADNGPTPQPSPPNGADDVTDDDIRKIADEVQRRLEPELKALVGNPHQTPDGFTPVNDQLGDILQAIHDHP